MAKVLSDLPPGLVLKGPEPAPKPSPAAQKGQGKVRSPKALERPGSGQRMNEYSEWMMRRCDAFGIASSRYFKKNGTCPTPK